MPSDSHGPAATLAEVAAVLSELFLAPETDLRPSLDRLLEAEALQAPDMAHVLAGVRMLRETGNSPQELETEYVRLFLQARDTPVAHPYESFFARGTLMAPECLEPLMALYEAAGLEFPPDASAPPDHISAELEFLSVLLERAASAREHGDAATTCALARELLDSHLLPFTESFAARLASASPHAYYEAAGRLLGQSLPVIRRRLVE